MNSKLIWRIIPFLATALPILVLLILTSYYNSSEFGHWPAMGSFRQYAAYSVHGVLALLALVINAIAIFKNRTLIVKIACIVSLLISAVLLIAAVAWFVSPTPY